VPHDATTIAGLRPYFESAHLDAREVFHRAARIDLHPEADAPSHHAQYPRCLPETSRKGLFGEVMAGLMAQSYRFVGGHSWSVPIFLFRYHAQVEAYIFELARNPARTREVAGRHGNDFIALGIDPNSGRVVRFLAGEAKGRAKLTPGTMETLMLGEWTGPAGARVRANDGVWNELNLGLAAPQGLDQMCRLLREKAADEYAEAILSLDEALLLNAAPLPRINFVFVAGNRAARRQPGQAYIAQQIVPPEYQAGGPLQVIELVVENGGALIDGLYDALWGDNG